MNLNNIPKHLKQYIVDQEYERYTIIDHRVWQFIMNISIPFFNKRVFVIQFETIFGIVSLFRGCPKFNFRAFSIVRVLPETLAKTSEESLFFVSQENKTKTRETLKIKTFIYKKPFIFFINENNKLNDGKKLKVLKYIFKPDLLLFSYL